MPKEEKTAPYFEKHSDVVCTECAEVTHKFVGAINMPNRPPSIGDWKKLCLHCNDFVYYTTTK